MANDKKTEKENLQSNADWQGVDKAPGEEKGKAEKVTKDDLKGKKVDADPTRDADKPLEEPK
jgi:hypothetical protein